MQLSTQTIIAAIGALWLTITALGAAYAGVQKARISRCEDQADRAEDRADTERERLAQVVAPMAATLAQVAATLQAQGAILAEVADYVAEQRWRDKMRAEGQTPESRRSGRQTEPPP